MKLFIIIVLILSVYTYLNCKVNIGNDQRGIVLRLAKYESIISPGNHVLVPFIDKVIMVKLDTYLSDWSLLPASEIDLEIKKQFLNDPDKFK